MRLEESDHNDLAYLLSLPEGARFLQRLVDEYGVYRPTYAVDENSARNAVFREGYRNAGLWLLHKIAEVAGGRETLLKAEAQRYALMLTDTTDPADPERM